MRMTEVLLNTVTDSELTDAKITKASEADLTQVPEPLRHLLSITNVTTTEPAAG
jgi:hypothetical protein